MIRSLFLLGLLALLAPSCSSVNPIPLSVDALSSARAYAAAERWESAWDELGEIDSDNLDRATLVEYNRLMGDAAWETGRESRSLRYYERYLSMRGPAAESRVAERRVYEVASEMLEGEHRTMGIFTNKWRGRSALQNLAAFAPESPYAPEALATVAGYSYDRDRFDDAAIDYQLLLAHYRDSEWGDLATFRLGMCGYYAAQDASTNRQLIEASRSQLDEYVRLFPNGQFLTQAQEAREGLRELEANYYLMLANYYERIDVADASLRYLKKARTFEGTPSAEEASLRIETAEKGGA